MPEGHMKDCKKQENMLEATQLSELLCNMKLIFSCSQFQFN